MTLTLWVHIFSSSCPFSLWCLSPLINKVWKKHLNFLYLFTSVNTPGSNKLRDVLHEGLQWRWFHCSFFIAFIEMATLSHTHTHIPSVDVDVHQEPVIHATGFFFSLVWKEHAYCWMLPTAQRAENIFNTRIYEYERGLLHWRSVFRLSLSNNKSPTTPITCSAPPAKELRGTKLTQRDTHQSGILTHAQLMWHAPILLWRRCDLWLCGY